MIDRKGIAAFLVLTFGITFAYEGALIAMGMRLNLGSPAKGPIPAQYLPILIGLVMWVPTLSTVIVIKFITKEGFGITNLRIGSWKPYLASALSIPGCFAVIYGLTWMTGLGSPDWDLGQLRRMTAGLGGESPAMPDSRILLPGIFVASLVLGPTINGIFGFGEEFGWRGYLLPKLMPLGKWKAYILVGMIWGFWHAPLILVGFNYPGYPALGVLAMMGMTTTLGIYINEMTLRHRSTILAGWMHGAFNGQFYGIWRVLFPTVNPLVGGVTGLVGMAVWTALGLAVVGRGGRTREGEAVNLRRCGGPRSGRGTT